MNNILNYEIALSFSEKIQQFSPEEKQTIYIHVPQSLFSLFSKLYKVYGVIIKNNQCIILVAISPKAVPVDVIQEIMTKTDAFYHLSQGKFKYSLWNGCDYIITIAGDDWDIKKVVEQLHQEEDNQKEVYYAVR